MIRYVPPRKVELDQGEKGNVFDDKRTRRKRADKYSSRIYPPETVEFLKEVEKYKKKS
jgi:hypothetical protein